MIIRCMAQDPFASNDCQRTKARDHIASTFVFLFVWFSTVVPRTMDSDGFVEYARTQTVHGMDVLVNVTGRQEPHEQHTAALAEDAPPWREPGSADSMPTAQTQHALLPAPIAAGASPPPRKDDDLGAALGHLLSPSPAATENDEPSLNLSEHGVDAWSLEAYIDHANGNSVAINKFIANTNDKFKTLYNLTLADLRMNTYENDKQHTDAFRSLQRQVDNLNVNSLLCGDQEGLVPYLTCPFDNSLYWPVNLQKLTKNPSHPCAPSPPGTNSLCLMLNLQTSPNSNGDCQAPFRRCYQSQSCRRNS